MALAKNSLVEVRWHDAYMLNDDEYVDEDEETPPPAITLSLGYVVRDERESEGEQQIVIAMSRLADEVLADKKITPVAKHLYRDRLVIPAGCIKAIRDLT